MGPYYSRLGKSGGKQSKEEHLESVQSEDAIIALKMEDTKKEMGT